MAHNPSLILRGWVATDPVHLETRTGRRVTKFRLADTDRRRDPETGEWRDGSTTWYTVELWGRGAVNAHSSLKKSDPVLVVGRPLLREWERDGASGFELVLRAETIGHDLSLGISKFERVRYTPENEEGGFARVIDSATPPGEALGAEMPLDPFVVDPSTGEVLDAEDGADDHVDHQTDDADVIRVVPSQSEASAEAKLEALLA